MCVSNSELVNGIIKRLRFFIYLLLFCEYATPGIDGERRLVVYNRFYYIHKTFELIVAICFMFSKEL